MTRTRLTTSAVCVATLLVTALLPAAPATARCTDDQSSPNFQPKAMYAYMIKGMTEAQNGKLDAADQTWSAAYQFMKEHCYRGSEWGRSLVPLIQNGKVQQAFDLFPDDNLMSMYGDVGADKPYERGLVAAKHGDFPTSAKEFQEATEVSAQYLGQSRFPDADFMLGMALYAQGKHTAAVRQWRLTLSDRSPAVPNADWSGPDQIWLSALQLYATQRVPPFS
jgi:TolA-binding protein